MAEKNFSNYFNHKIILNDCEFIHVKKNVIHSLIFDFIIISNEYFKYLKKS